MKDYLHAEAQYKTAVLVMLIHDKIKIKPMAGDKRKH